MQIQTSVIQIDCSYCRCVIIRYKYFCMYKSWRIFVNLNPCFDQFFIIGLCYCKGIPLVWNMRHNDNDFNSRLGNSCQRCDHLIIQNQIWCHNMYILFRMIQNMEVYLFSNIFIIKRAVCIWNNISKLSSDTLSFRCAVTCIIFWSLLIRISHFHKNHRKTLYCISF